MMQAALPSSFSYAYVTGFFPCDVEKAGRDLLYRRSRCPAKSVISQQESAVIESLTKEDSQQGEGKSD